ncbi:hypothetical protein BGZ63DRAFT_431619 [Mariannaea sp. PMI_226]|nr:hypothetical protein BGZ63DRAFT_431619 [Mariannaea sp. PMI_226]
MGTAWLPTSNRAHQVPLRVQEQVQSTHLQDEIPTLIVKHALGNTIINLSVLPFVFLAADYYRRATYLDGRYLAFQRRIENKMDLKVQEGKVELKLWVQDRTQWLERQSRILDGWMEQLRREGRAVLGKLRRAEETVEISTKKIEALEKRVELMEEKLANMNSEVEYGP